MSWSLEEAVSYYKKQGAPQDQNALLTLLKEIQNESNGAIPERSLKDVAEAYGVKETFIKAVIARIPSLKLENTHSLELCSGINCSKARGLEAHAQRLCKEKGVTFKRVPCMRMCGSGPNVRFDGKVYNKADENLIEKLF